MKTEGPETIRTDVEVRPLAVRLAAELNSDPAKFYNDCVKAIIELINDDTPLIPSLVTFARTLRENRATMLDKRRPFVKVFHEDVTAPPGAAPSTVSAKKKVAPSK